METDRRIVIVGAGGRLGAAPVSDSDTHSNAYRNANSHSDADTYGHTSHIG